MTEPRKILLVLSEICANGGIQRFNRTFLAACLKLGCDCEVLSLRDDATSIARFPLDERVRLTGFGGNRLQFALALFRRMRRGRYDDVLVGHINFVELVVTALAFAPRRVRSLLVGHGIEVWNSIGPRRRRALRAIDCILCVSNYTRESFKSQAPALASERLLLFPNALSEAWESKQNVVPVVTARALPERFLLAVTRLARGDRYKGIVTTLEALRRVDESLHCVVVGNGDDLTFLQGVAKRFGVFARTHWLGSLSDEELTGLYRNCEAFVLPSGKEGFGIVFLEAMFFGAPVIAAREKGALDVVIDGETGLLVDYGDVVGLSRAIEGVANDRALRRDIVRRARDRVTGDGAFTYASFVRRCASALEFDDARAIRSTR